MIRKIGRARTLLALVTVTALSMVVLASPRSDRTLRPLRLLVDLARRVDLTAEQRGQIRTILESHRAELVAIVDAERASRVALRRTIHEPMVDEGAIRAASAEVAAVDAAFAVERAEIYAEVAAVLTPAQRAAVEAFIAEVRPLVEAEIDRAVHQERHLKGLGLSDGQRDEIRRILASHLTSVESLLGAERETRESLVASIRRPSVDEQSVRAAAAAVAAVDADLAVERAEIAAEISAVLTPEQRERARDRIERLHERLFSTAIDALDVGLRLL